jgi:hypothetical protein
MVHVRQSSENATVYHVEEIGYDVVLTFLSATKGRMDFSVSLNDEPRGKVNVLSQYSIKRLAKDCKIKDEDFQTNMLKAGLILKDGEYEAAEFVSAEKKEAESLYGDIEDKDVNDFLGDTNLLDKVNTILHESRDMPFVGDDANLILTFLVMLSCKTDAPLNLELIGQSASGKTYMTLTARNGFPKSMCMVLAGASREAMKYDYDEIDEDGNFIVNVDGKCIIILEKDESFAFIQRMKPLMSGDDKELIWKTPMKNEMTGEIETRDFIIRGQPAFITLTTRNPKEQEQITRQLLMTPQTSVSKVGNVVRNQLMAKARPETFTVNPLVHTLQASMLSLRKNRVRNIFAPLLAEFFPSRNAQHQRDVKKVLSVIDAVTLLHSHQRPTQTDKTGTYILSSIEDNIVGLLLCDIVLRASLSGVPDDAWNTFLQMQTMADSKRRLTIDAIQQWLNLHAFSVSKSQIKEKHLPTLEDAGLIEVANRGGGRGGGRKTYKIVKSREGLLDTYALTPLFIEAVRDNLKDVIADFSDVLGTSERAKSIRALTKNEGKILRSIGCKTKEESEIWRSLFLPNYFRTISKGNLLWKIIGTSDNRDVLYSGQAWFDNTWESKATEKLEAKRELREEMRVTTMKTADIDNDSLWDSLMESHLEDLEE